MFEGRKRTARGAVALGLAAFALLFAGTHPGGEASGLRATAPTLGSAASFAVLGGSTVTNTGATTISGNLGISPGSAVTGFPPGLVTGGTIHAADAAAAQAQADLTIAYNSLTSQACDVDLTGQDLGGKTLTPGVYCFQSSAQLTGPLTLDAQGNADAVFVFKIGSTLTTASGSSVLTINGGSACNVFWQVGTSATLGTTTSFLGNILSLTSITLNNGASLSGRALARNGAVTMDNNAVSQAACGAAAATATPTATVIATSIPAIATVTAAATAPTSAPVAAAATSTVVATATATAIATPPPATPTTVVVATATAIKAPVTTVSPSLLPAQLPNSGEGLPGGAGWAGLLSLGVLLLVGGLGVRLVRARLPRA